MTTGVDQVEGDVVLVTGAGSGIGKSIAKRLVSSGVRVGLADVDKESLVALSKELDSNSIAVTADVTDLGSIESAVAAVCSEWGRLDGLVNAAGWDRMGLFLETNPALWERLIGINLLGTINASFSALRRLVEQRKGGAVINIASDAGRVGSSGEAVYSAAKGGVIALTKSLAREMARHSIRVNCVCPGPTDTPLLKELTSEEIGSKIIEAMVRQTPMRRLARPEEVAYLVHALLDRQASFVTGQIISVSGGLTMAG